MGVRLVKHPEEWEAFRKKPVVIAAKEMKKPFCVSTIEGDMEGKKGDYLIIGVEGEMYPCDQRIFKKTYEPVNRRPTEKELTLRT